MDLGGGYRLQKVSDEVYRAACTELEDQIFQYFEYRWPTAAQITPPIQTQTFSWGFFYQDDQLHGEDLIGWHHAQQLDARIVLMADSGLLPQHQGHGLYTKALPHLLTSPPSSKRATA